MILESSMKCSTLWPMINEKILTLNMRLDQNEVKFGKWLKRDVIECGNNCRKKELLKDSITSTAVIRVKILPTEQYFVQLTLALIIST